MAPWESPPPSGAAAARLSARSPGSPLKIRGPFLWGSYNKDYYIQCLGICQGDPFCQTPMLLLYDGYCRFKKLTWTRIVIILACLLLF